MKLALDANRYTDLRRGNVSVVETVELADEVWLPFTVLGELLAGFAVGRLVLGRPGPRNEAVLRRFLLKSASVCSMPMNGLRIITALLTGNCESKALPSRPTICGSRPSCYSIRSSCVPVMCTLPPCPSCRACRESKC